jgi:L-threonylcarbamoyladenylate synthase
MNFDKCIDTLKTGGIILHKTDTVWGLACDAQNPKAIERLKTIKNRDSNKALIVLIADITQLNIYVQQVPDVAWDLVEFAEKPLTVVYQKMKNLPQGLSADGSIGIRLVKDQHCHALLRRFGKGLVSSSANIAGGNTPQLYSQIDKQIIDAVDYVLPFEGPETANEASTIVKLDLDGGIKFLRK